MCWNLPGYSGHDRPARWMQGLSMSLLQLAIFAAVMGAALSAVMAVAWRVQELSGNTGWIDVFWTFGLGAVSLLASLVPAGGGPWPHARQILVAALVALWSLRLGWHILMRTRAVGDDPRYRQLLAQWGVGAARRMFWQLQSQAAVSLVLALSIVLAARNPHPGLRIQDLLGMAMLIGGIVGEAVADHQLRRFKANPASRTSVCDTGLWRWSRHPNYFFEWLCWLAYPLIAIDLSGYSPHGWLAVAAPACMYWVLVYVSGLPPLEQHMLRTRGEAFRAYRARTRAFFPIPGGFRR
jgi:steroid 5-alpha reductase family enzyme